MALVLGAAWLAARLAASVDHTAKPPGPFSFVTELVKGHFAWSGAATMWAVGEGAVLAVVGSLVATAVWRWRGRRPYVDRRARLMARDLPSLRRYIDPELPRWRQSTGRGCRWGAT